MLKGIMHEQRTHGRWSVSLHDEARPGVDPCCWVRGRRWHGVISRNTTPDLVETCSRAGVPLADLADTPPAPGVAKVRPDNHAIGRLGAAYFLERRFTSFAFTGYSGHNWSRERRDGFRDSLARGRHRCDVLEVEQPDDLTPAWDARQIAALAGWLRSLPTGTAIMGCDDQRAHQVVRAARATGLQVPDEIAVLGANNQSMRCELADPSISSIAINAFEAGRRAAVHLEQMIAGTASVPVDERIAPLGVVTRKSTDVMGARDPAVAAALAYIREHACRGLTVDEILAQVSISRSQLEHKLRRYIGRSPQVEIRRVQVARVCELLTETTLPLKEIAHQTGFTHVEYLSVVFKRITGDTPGQYRTKHTQSFERPWMIA